MHGQQNIKITSHYTGNDSYFKDTTADFCAHLRNSKLSNVRNVFNTRIICKLQ